MGIFDIFGRGGRKDKVSLEHIVATRREHDAFIDVFMYDLNIASEMVNSAIAVAPSYEAVSAIPFMKGKSGNPLEITTEMIDAVLLRVIGDNLNLGEALKSGSATYVADYFLPQGEEATSEDAARVSIAKVALARQIARSALGYAEQARIFVNSSPDSSLPRNLEKLTCTESEAHSIMTAQALNLAELYVTGGEGFESFETGRVSRYVNEAKIHAPNNSPSVSERIAQIKSRAHKNSAMHDLGVASGILYTPEDSEAIGSQLNVIREVKEKLSSGDIKGARELLYSSAAIDSEKKTRPFDIGPNSLSFVEELMAKTYSHLTAAGFDCLNGNGEPEIKYRRLETRLLRAQIGRMLLGS